MIEYWHNPRCSKSRQGLALLEERGAEIELRRYLEDAPSLEELRATQAALGVSAIAMMRTGEARFKELGLSKSDPDAVLLAAMAESPVLIERPLAIKGDRAVIGRPPEDMLSLLD
ncbi:arsenate reductase (glutaredoxin) [Ruegeria pomeroyi]|uniref:Arsenate reductase n=2 Tax=Ruegeria pomeroyi TaxID=89184 RepID=Q5LPE0_RUEPO|nr:arsenate reductase (glutaredoxin) [Ruegeria pomeroyi]HCE72717.1 arsenate reductase (glutaredoxin) [Ruegeria sp.]AAV96149.1 arsenate reductase [Ruegeria pomeroyi DSS-3]NVK97348.1 arsenate reductase (glutaredoxin) [Ruegeria pomeroyi]NVL00704.1 arsenate reductase (glutaredoxin) [Ruegeria pomeroyi]QWV09700.1 arsenate reductase (glutaredoxin) [Ruegeria pomeroyi]